MCLIGVGIQSWTKESTEWGDSRAIEWTRGGGGGKGEAWKKASSETTKSEGMGTKQRPRGIEGNV